MANSNIPARILAKMRPLSLNTGREADYFKVLEDLLGQIQDQVGLESGELNSIELDQLKLDVAQLEVDVEQVEDEAALNTAGVATNAGNISTNATNISTNTSNILTNTANIAILLTKVFNSIVVVRSASDFGVIDSAKTYYIDGQIDMGSTSISVPAGGITFGGFGFNISKLYSSENSYTMLTGATAGDVFVAGQGLTFEVTGTGSSVVGLTNGSGNSAVEFNFTNFENCTSIGYLDGYRQLLMRNVGLFGTADGLDMRNNWSGGARINDFIVRGFGSSGTIFKSGTGLSIGGRFSMEANIDLPSGTSSVADFAPGDFVQDGSFQIQNSFITRNGVIDVEDANYFPNTNEGDVESSWLGNTGIPNTVIGGVWECTAESTTSISAASTYYKIAGTTTAANLDHMDQSGNNELRLITDQPQDIAVTGSIKIEQNAGFGDEITILTRVYRDASATYDDYRSVQAAIPNLTALDNVATITLIDRVTMDLNDRVELWISNESGTGDMTMKEGSFLQLRRT